MIVWLGGFLEGPNPPEDHLTPVENCGSGRLIDRPLHHPAFHLNPAFPIGHPDGPIGNLLVVPMCVESKMRGIIYLVIY